VPSSSSAPHSPRTGGTRRTAVTALAALAIAALTGACRVDAQVAVRADADGTGEVRVAATLDPAAVTKLVGEAAGDPAVVNPATRIDVDDLRQAGWTVDGPDETKGGGLRVVAHHRYDDAAEAEALLTQVGAGPFQDVRLHQDRSFFKTHTSFAATVDLSKGLGAFTDDELRQALRATDEAPLGITPAQLEQRFGKPLGELLGLEVDVRLPGRLTTTTPDRGTDPDAGTSDRHRALWTPALGQRLELTAESERWNGRNIAALVVALASATALVAVLLRRRHEALTVTASNNMVDTDGETGTDRGGA
jgi:hypothetical protein